MSVTDDFGRYIKVASDSAIVQRAGGYRRWCGQIIRRKWRTARPNWEIRGGDYAVAEIIRGDWVIRCPYCLGGQLAEPGEPFVCVDCMNVANAGYAIDVVWPKPEERHAIEALLLRRSDTMQMNYLPRDGETYESLVAESIEHGDLEVE